MECVLLSKCELNSSYGLPYVKFNRASNYFFLSTPQVELNISGNPVLRDESRLEEMTEKIRDVLPTLKILNGTTLPKRISFEDDDDAASKSLPTSVKKLSTNDLDVNELVLRFLREYFTIYDSDNR